MRMCCLGKLNATSVVEEFCSLGDGHRVSPATWK